MLSRFRSPWILIVGGVALAAVVLGAVWEIAPEDARGLLMLVAGVLVVAVYLVLYAIERRRHWGS